MTTSSPDQQSVNQSTQTLGTSFQVPYLISNQPDGTLPDMKGFGLERVGSAEGGWYSLCPIKADRDLVKGEIISACLVHRRSGELTRFDYTAKAGKLGKAQWLNDFAKEAAVLPITVGAWDDCNVFSSNHKDPRLWSQADYRAFSTAPFDSNLVQVLACDDSFTLGDGKTLSLQVRDLKTQALHEQHLFTAKIGSGWSKALCEKVNDDSRLLRAGIKSADCTVTPGEAKNAFWGPQCAELSVTLTEVNWWASRMLDDKKAVPDGYVLHAWAYDTFSQRLLGHHQWTPNSTQRAAGKWLKAWAAALAKSQVAPYLRVNTTTAMLEQRGDGLRIFARLPGDDYAAEGPLLAPAFEAPEDAVLVTVRHPGNQALLHHALFRPQASAALPSDEQSWLQALASFIETQQWPELYVKDGRQLWLLRDAELQVALENVGDGREWESKDYWRELLSADEWPHEKAVDPVTITVEPTEGLTGVTISSLESELAFRLDNKARDKGYRVMACVPRQSAAKQLREAYISYVEATVKAGFPVAFSFAEAGTLTAAAAAAAVFNAIPADPTGVTRFEVTPRNLVFNGTAAVLGSTEFVDFVRSIGGAKGYFDADAAVYAAIYDLAAKAKAVADADAKAKAKAKGKADAYAAAKAAAKAADADADADAKAVEAADADADADADAKAAKAAKAAYATYAAKAAKAAAKVAYAAKAAYVDDDAYDAADAAYDAASVAARIAAYKTASVAARIAAKAAA